MCSRLSWRTTSTTHVGERGERNALSLSYWSIDCHHKEVGWHLSSFVRSSVRGVKFKRVWQKFSSRQQPTLALLHTVGTSRICRWPSSKIPGTWQVWTRRSRVIWLPSWHQDFSLPSQSPGCWNYFTRPELRDSEDLTWRTFDRNILFWVYPGSLREQ